MSKKTDYFKIADASKRKLSKVTFKRIRNLYKDVAREQRKNLQTASSRDKYYLHTMLTDLELSIEKLDYLIEQEITASALASANLIVDAQNKLMESAGLAVEGAYSYVPEQVVANIMSGGPYKGDWKLNEAIWKAGKKTKSDIQLIVSKGLAENKSTLQIAKDLEKYVNPSAKKPWDWSKVYPGSTEKVDYNAQRLARTMIQHSYQQSMVQAMKYNPFCNGIIWHSVFAHGRTCALCRERDGHVYAKSKLPLDHPNGLCYFEPALDDMNKIGNDLADWVHGKPNKGIDLYVEHMFRR